eukprot:244783-Hanusia_phi.AAC.5
MNGGPCPRASSPPPAEGTGVGNTRPERPSPALTVGPGPPEKRNATAPTPPASTQRLSPSTSSLRYIDQQLSYRHTDT